MRCNYHLLVAFLIIFVILLMSVEFTGAIGLSAPSLKMVIDFEPNLERTFSFVMVTNAGKPMDYIISVMGEYPNFFHLSTERFVQVPSGESRAFTVTMQLPEKIDVPGTHDHLICALEGEGRGGGGIGTRVEVCASIAIRVLFDYKFLLIENFDVPDGDKGDVIPLQVTVKSWTKQNIDSIKAVIDIFSPDENGNFNKKVTTLYTEEKALPSNTKEVLTAYLNTINLEPGEYKAFVKVLYDENETNESAKFKLGSLTVKVLNYTRIFERGKVNRFDVEIGSRWNNKIEKIYADITIENDTLKTPFVSIEPWQSTNVTTYWDLTGKKAGDYNGVITLYYGENSSNTDINVKVIVGKQEIQRVLLSVIIGCVIIVLIIILVILSLKTSSLKNEKSKKQKTNKIKKA